MAQTVTAGAETSEVKIPGTHVRTLHSRIVGQEYRLLVSLPAGYGESTQHYPVVFLLDAQWDFPLLYAIYGEQYYDGFVPGLILVGLEWGGEKPDPNVLRRRDFTPSDESGNGDSGGAASCWPRIRVATMAGRCPHRMKRIFTTRANF
jgi:predicted alpha/beta superfamily hydrolase